VQDAMLQLVRSYANRGEQEWGPLFHTILQSRISDWRRRAKVRNRLRVWFGGKQEDDDSDPLQNMVDNRSPDPPGQLRDKQAMAVLEAAIHKLPPRQQQAFMLRVWEGLDIAQTAREFAFGKSSVRISEGFIQGFHSAEAFDLIYDDREELVDPAPVDWTKIRHKYWAAFCHLPAGNEDLINSGFLFTSGTKQYFQHVHQPDEDYFT